MNYTDLPYGCFLKCILLTIFMTFVSINIPPCVIRVESGSVVAVNMLSMSIEVYDVAEPAMLVALIVML